jgi:hypothetical protein
VCACADEVHTSSTSGVLFVNSDCRQRVSVSNSTTVRGAGIGDWRAVCHDRRRDGHDESEYRAGQTVSVFEMSFRSILDSYDFGFDVGVMQTSYHRRDSWPVK